MRKKVILNILYPYLSELEKNVLKLLKTTMFITVTFSSDDFLWNVVFHQVYLGKKLKGREPCDGNIDEKKKAQLTVRIWLQ